MTKEDVAKPRGDSGSKFDDTIHTIPSHGQGETTATGAKASNDMVVDDAAKYLANASQFAPLTPEKEKKLRQKIDSWMIPLVIRPRMLKTASLLI